MLESQKLSFQEFALGYRHGVYVLVSDSCEICRKYQKSIEYINNANLYFVDVVTSEERDFVYKLTQRAAFPMTVVFWDNQLEYVRLGQLFELQMEEIFESLKKFGDNPLSNEEKQRRIQAIKTRCDLSYYIFPPDCDAEIKNTLMCNCVKYNELPIDVESICPNLDEDTRYHIIEGNLPFAKLIIYRDQNTNMFSGFAQRILMGYTSRVKDARFIIRKIEEELNATNNTDINQNK